MQPRQLSMIAVEASQPVGALDLLARALRRRVAEEGEVSEILDDIDLGLRQVRRQLASLLDRLRADHFLDHPESEKVALMPLFEKLALQTDRLARENRVRLSVLPTGARVISDPASLEVILRNLLINALCFAPGGRAILGCRRRGSMVEVQVCDNGVGIAPEHLEEIFEPLRKAPHDGEELVGGLGLGLAIAHELADSLGHALVLRSELGRGTVGSLTLPLGAHGATSKGSATGIRGSAA